MGMAPLSLYIFEIATYFFNAFSVGIGIAIRKKMTITAVQRARFAGVLDRAPVLLGPGGYLLDIGNEPVEIPAVHAIYFFNEIQVRQGMAIDDDIVAAPDFGDTVHRKAHGMIEGENQVQKNRRNQAGPDDRRGKDVQQGRFEEIGMQFDHQGFLVLPGGVFEVDFSA